MPPLKRPTKSADKHDTGVINSTGLRVKKPELALGQMPSLMIPSAKMFSPIRNRLVLWYMQTTMGAAHHSRIFCDFFSRPIVTTLH
jgi:hypothetical protein